MVSEAGEASMLKAGAELITSAMNTTPFRPPSVPVMATKYVPATAEALAVSVSALLPVVGFGLNAAVTPLGSPGAARVTLPVNPFWGITVMVAVLEAP